jgi:hypothetical protein
MNDMERRKFEDSFQEAFKDAEINPSENVWTNIELDLERANGDNMKRRIIFFKMLAAASVVFALCAGGLTYYIFSDNQANTNIAQQDAASENPTDEKRATAEESEGPQQALRNDADKRIGEELADVEKAVTEQSSNSSLPDRAIAQHQEKNDAASTDGLASSTDQKLSHRQDINRRKPENSSLTQNDVRNSQPDSRPRTESQNSNKTLDNPDNNQIANRINSISGEPTLISESSSGLKSPPWLPSETERKLPAFYEPVMPELELPVSTADPGMVLLAKLADEEKKYASEQKTKMSGSEKLWTSVGFAAGAFNANNPNVTPAPSNSFYNMNANSVNTAAKQSKASGTSYSLGVSMGTMISERWVVQGGINYLTQSSDYTANSVVVIDNNYSSLKAESVNAFTGQIADASSQPKVAQTFPYNVNNNVRFVSVPVQAGYLLLNKKFGVQLNAGVSTDLFLQNTITPDGGGVTKTTQGRGDDSPYRSLNFSGLMGTELSYKLGSKYRLSLNPGLRFPFNSVYKESTGIDATPLTFDVGLRFRYIFH